MFIFILFFLSFYLFHFLFHFLFTSLFFSFLYKLSLQGTKMLPQWYFLESGLFCSIQKYFNVALIRTLLSSLLGPFLTITPREYQNPSNLEGEGGLPIRENHLSLNHFCILSNKTYHIIGQCMFHQWAIHCPIIGP